MPPSLSFPRLRLRHDQFELRTAIELGKKIVLVHGESNKRRTSLLASCGTIDRVTDARLLVPACFLRGAETEGAHGKFDFASEKAAAPDDLRGVLDGACYRRMRSISLCFSVHAR